VFVFASQKRKSALLRATQKFAFPVSCLAYRPRCRLGCPTSTAPAARCLQRWQAPPPALSRPRRPRGFRTFFPQTKKEASKMQAHTRGHTPAPISSEEQSVVRWLRCSNVKSTHWLTELLGVGVAAHKSSVRSCGARPLESWSAIAAAPASPTPSSTCAQGVRCAGPLGKSRR